MLRLVGIGIGDRSLGTTAGFGRERNDERKEFRTFNFTGWTDLNDCFLFIGRWFVLCSPT